MIKCLKFEEPLFKSKRMSMHDPTPRNNVRVLGLARSIYIQYFYHHFYHIFMVLPFYHIYMVPPFLPYVYGISGKSQTVVYGVCIRFWPTLTVLY